MNHRETPPLPAGVRRTLRCLSVLLLPALAPEAAPALPRPRHALGQDAGDQGSDSLPYLFVAGAPPLRFQARVAPPADLVTRPAAAAPPIPPLTPAESAVAQANVDAARSMLVSAHAMDAAPVTETKAEPKPAATAPKPAPRSILPDDTRAPVRPEDFLPFFQLPGSAKTGGEVNVIVPLGISTAPAPAPLPPSTATYTQSPK